MSQIKMLKIDENILMKSIKVNSIDSELPFRLQKTQLFKELGFPVKKTIPIPIKEEEKIEKEFEKFQESEIPFFIITSPKPMLTRVPPLFRIDVANAIIYRDWYENVMPINQKGILDKIRLLPQKSWVEFTKNIWGGDTIAGRLAYASEEEQVLEIQKGVDIPEIDRSPDASFRITLSFFECPGFLRDARLKEETLQKLGFEQYEIKKIIYSLRKYSPGFEGLKQVANLPVLEFAFTKQNGLLVIDADWPTQYRL